MIPEITSDEGVAIALDSLLNDRLVLLAGAGLSMAPPSSLKSAAQIAAAAKAKYDATYGVERPPLPEKIEDQAEFFFERHQLATAYFRTFIDHHAFAGPPNPGHFAAADLLLIRAIQTAATTNVDTLIEVAGHMLFGQVGVGIDGLSVAALPVDTAPLLKIHGCRERDCDNMVWAPGQLAVEPVASRIASSRDFLTVRLLDRDLIIIGYWTDWDYLNGVLTTALGAVRPSRVIVVDTCDGASFETKAPALYALGQRAANLFQHVKASGADFLAAVRLGFSKSFVRRVLHAGIDEFVEQTGAAPLGGWTEPPDLDNDTLWRIRRDLEGRHPNEPAKDRNPPAESLVGLTILQLRARGAVPDGAYWQLGGRRVRVLRAPNIPLHRVQAAFDREMPSIVAPDVIVAVGAEAQPLLPHFARARTRPTIARGSSGRWMTRLEAVMELNL